MTDRPSRTCGAPSAGGVRTGVRVHTFGCKVNRYESRLMEENFELNGLPSAGGSGAALEVINSCCVTARAEKGVRNLAARLARRGAEVVVTGCLAARAAAEAGLPAGVVLLDRDRLAERYFARRAARVGGFGGRTRAFVKIEDGCESFCAYCIIPLVRGRVRSRPQDDILAEVSCLARRHREIVLTGINLGAYGSERGDRLDSLLRDIFALPGVGRVRLSSIEPCWITPRLLSVCAAGPAFCRHLHIPLQSGADRVLAAMGRPYRMADYERTIERVREALPGATVTTDAIAGFPGETEAEFAETEAAVGRIGFLRVHAFPFSPRPGTAAERMDGRPPGPVVRERVRRLMEAGAAAGLRVMRGFAGSVAEVLVEGRRTGRYRQGYAREYLPVLVPAEAATPGEIVRVVLGDPVEGRVPGTPVR